MHLIFQHNVSISKQFENPFFIEYNSAMISYNV